MAELDRGLAQSLKRTADQIRDHVGRMCDKAARVHANNLGTGARHLRRLSNTLMPRGEPQERVLGPLPFVARHGFDWVDEVFEHVPAFPQVHRVLVREESAAPSAAPEED
jgi:hypothetical protein